jgi:hypothetical protein
MRLAKVTSRMHNAKSRMHSAENEVRDLKRAASSHPEDQSPVLKKKCIEEAVRQIFQLQEEHRISARKEPHSRSSPAKRGKGEVWHKQVPPEVSWPT